MGYVEVNDVTYNWPQGAIPGLQLVPWQVAPWHAVQIEVFINWLETEIEERAEDRLPLLKEIQGHRNREVYHFVQDNMERYSERAAHDLYGNMPKYFEIAPHWMQTHWH